MRVLLFGLKPPVRCGALPIAVLHHMSSGEPTMRHVIGRLKAKLTAEIYGGLKHPLLSICKVLLQLTTPRVDKCIEAYQLYCLTGPGVDEGVEPAGVDNLLDETQRATSFGQFSEVEGVGCKDETAQDASHGGFMKSCAEETCVFAVSYTHLTLPTTPYV